MRLFEPTKIDMFREYPELKEYKEFNGLSNPEMAFSWLCGCQESDLIAIEDLQDRRKQAYELVWGNTEDSRYVDFITGNLPEKVRSAIEKFKTFNPSTRMRAKLMVEQMFTGFEALMKEPMPADPNKMKALAEAKLKIAGELPDLIKRLEGGFGFKDDVKDADKREPTFMDGIHDELARQSTRN